MFTSGLIGLKVTKWLMKPEMEVEVSGHSLKSITDEFIRDTEDLLFK